MPNKRYTLNEAREAVQLGNYSDALERYNNFFEYTFKNSAKYGVRLSYCLREWVELGKVYPDALIRLERKKINSLLLLEEEREPERFHDYLAICEAVQSPELPIKEFLRLHNSDKELSTKIVRFIWDDLIKNKKWKICMEYLDNPFKKYETYLSNFDTIFKKYVHDNSTSHDKEIFAHTLNWYIKEITNILLVLKNNNKIEDYNLIRKRISSDLVSRGLSKLEVLIDRRVE
jgi:hypothetical protein